MHDSNTMEPTGWTEAFLSALRGGKSVVEATGMVGIGRSAIYRRRSADPAFRAAWQAIRPFKEKRPPSHATTRRPYGEAKLARFLTKLAETSNVSAAAESADVSVGKVYKLRRENPEFARRWYAALAEGYDNLEMELLGRLRAGEGGEQAAETRRKFDTAAALRCLAAHRESVAREKGRRALADEVATIEAINAKIDTLRLASEEGERAIAEARQAKRREAQARTRARVKPLPAPKGRGPSSLRSPGAAGTSPAAGNPDHA